MKRRLTSRRLGGSVLAAALLASSGVHAAAVQSVRPANLKPSLDTPEAGLWGMADKAEIHIRNSADVNRDPALNAFVREVVCKVAPEYCGEVRIYVLDRPALNASAFPNGYLEVWSGLMLRAQTEDELAYVLGHEVAHFAGDHSIEQWNKTKTTANVMLALQVGVSIGTAAAVSSAASSGAPNAGGTIDSISRTARAVNDLIYLSGMASIYSFGRAHESEADEIGFRRAVAAGYAAGSGAELWSDVVAETQASDFPKVRASESRASIFNTHPITKDRIARLASLSGGAGGGDAAARKRYRAHIRPHLADWLKDDLRRRDYGQTLHLIARLEQDGEDLGVLSFYRGVALRQRRGPGDAEAAMAAYASSVTHPDAPAAAWRELGDALIKSGDKARAAEAFQSYLVRAPKAEDRWMVESALKSIQAPESK